MKKLSFFAILLALAGWALPVHADEVPAKKKAPKSAMSKVVLSVSGMTWGAGCATRVSRILKKIEGVKKVKVSLARGKAYVKGVPGMFTGKTLVAALAKSKRYKGKVISESHPEIAVIHLSVSGMTWGAGCASRVSRILNGVKGVKKVKVSLAKKSAWVKGYTSKMTHKDLVAALAKSKRYKGKVVKAEYYHKKKKAEKKK